VGAAVSQVADTVGIALADGVLRAKLNQASQGVSRELPEKTPFGSREYTTIGAGRRLR
jgi:hypothetical protein